MARGWQLQEMYIMRDYWKVTMPSAGLRCLSKQIFTIII